MSRTIALTYTYPHPIEKVWRALTDPKALAMWFMENDFAPQVGHEFTFRTDPAPGFDGVIRCKVLEVDEPHRIHFTWAGGPIDTKVTWSLEESEKGTRFSMTQDGFRGARPFLISLLLKSGGKKLYGDALARYLEGEHGLPDGAPRCWRPQTRFFARLATLFVRERDTDTNQAQRKNDA